VFAKIKSLLSAASGKKVVTWIGLIVAAISAICLRLGPEWIHEHMPWLEVVCTIAGALGTFAAAAGRGLADRRDPDRENRNV
jgi:hypothetical protein